jgi:hypothetical protein
MLRSLIAAALMAAVLSSAAEAGHRRHSQPRAPGTLASDQCNLPGPNSMPCEGVTISPRGLRIVKGMGGFGAARPRYFAPNTRKGASGMAPELAAKVAEIARSCGSSIISGVRHTRVAGTRHWSQHANGTAADLSGNPRCIYASLQRWPGGYSTDYGRVGHVHISIGGREAGLRFAHHRHPAKRRHRHYAGLE